MAVGALKILDAEIVGNVARFYLGDVDLDAWWGDDWDDVPYEHNAGSVYFEFVKAVCDVAWDLDHVVVEPCDGTINSPWCKDDMRARHVPVFAVLSVGADRWMYEGMYGKVVGSDAATRVYMGDVVDTSGEMDCLFGGRVLTCYEVSNG